METKLTSINMFSHDWILLSHIMNGVWSRCSITKLINTSITLIVYMSIKIKGKNCKDSAKETEEVYMKWNKIERLNEVCLSTVNRSYFPFFFLFVFVFLKKLCLYNLINNTGILLCLYWLLVNLFHTVCICIIQLHLATDLL